MCGNRSLALDCTEDIVLNDREHSALVLVIADDEEIRDGIQVLLEADGYRVIGARNIEDPVQPAVCQAPDLILATLDSQPSKFVASAVQVRIRLGLSESVPIVIFCCPTIPEGAELQVDKNVYLTRPVNFDQLRRLLRQLLSRTVTQH